MILEEQQMSSKKKTDGDNTERSDLNKLIEEESQLLEDLKNQPPVEFTFSDADYSKLIGEINSSFSSDELQKLLEDVSSADSELNVTWPETDFSALLKDTENIEPGPIPEPNPSLTAKDVADWMSNQVQTNGRLYQRKAVWHIRRYFGERFIYINRNNNLAVSKDVLREFLLISLQTVVWNRRERFWRTRRSSDPRNRRMVDN